MPFYKKDEDNNLLIANIGVDAPDYQLKIEDKDTYQYPIHDWYYFDSDAEAYSFFGIDYQSNV